VAGSREAILGKLRASGAAPMPLPELPKVAPGFPDTGPAALAERFVKWLESVGGHCVRVESRAGLDAAVRALPESVAAKQAVSCVPGVGRSDLDLATVTDPHQLAGVDFALVPGELGVAENGAVWVSEAKVDPRAVLFLTQQLAIVLDASALVPDLHAAYARLPLGQRGFGLFISGPSKTADIEQALVLGAHGARGCTVLLVG
jgi:L-lactate dehydrogenase complex protein LldG